MSYDSIEQSPAQSQPFELYQFVIAGQTFFFTSADQPIVYLGQTYTPSTIRRTEMEHSNEVVFRGKSKFMFRRKSQIAQLLIPYLTPTPMFVTVFAGTTATRKW